MKVVLFCGGYGMRMRNGQSDVPKPMTTVGPRPLLWHVMRYYAHFGHTDFVLCLGYGAHHVKDYFLHYDETASNDFVLSGGNVHLLGSDIRDWTITFVQTGLTSPIGERLRRVREHVDNKEMFLANYADVLTDMPLDDMIEQFRAQPDKVGALLAGRRSRPSTAWTSTTTSRSSRSPRCSRCRSGRTAATSCCAPRSSTTFRRTAISSPTARWCWPRRAA
jgi:glucose-1-phosphate cytidylyltransferase